MTTTFTRQFLDDTLAVLDRLDDDSVSSHLADCGRCGALRSALATLLDTGDDAVLPGEARRIRAWLYSLAPCDRNGDSPP